MQDKVKFDKDQAVRMALALLLEADELLYKSRQKDREISGKINEAKDLLREGRDDVPY